MGISGLLPLLENSSRTVNISQFRGRTAAVDSYCWLHKGAFGCSDKLARGEETNGYVLYCLKYIRILQNAGVRPIMVFDGQHLPAKRETEEKRREQRKVARKRAAELLRLDRPNEARNFLRQCIDVTHDMALALIKECRQMGVDCIVAPYEADAQLAYLSIKKIVDLVITEDSDLVLFGCDKILFKLDVLGNGTLVEKEKLYLSMQMSPDSYNFDKFRYMCILSGCDYIQSLPGIGLKKALKFIKLTENPDIYKILTKLPAYLNMRQIVVSDEYREEFMVALATFKHQIVYDPLNRKLERLTDVESSETKIEHCRNAGEFFDENIAFQLALGNLDPFSLKKVDDWNPDKTQLKLSSIWSRDYNKSVTKPQPSSPSLLRKVNSRKTTDITIQVKSLSVVEKDDDFEKELEIYKTKKVEKIDEIDYKAKEEEEDIVRRLLIGRKSFNPFIKENRSSQTTTDTKQIVRSRFFNKTSSDSIVSTNSRDTSGYLTHDSKESSSLEQNSDVASEDNTVDEQFEISSRQNIDALCEIINLETNEKSTSQLEKDSITTSIRERFSLDKNNKMMSSLENYATKSDELALNYEAKEDNFEKTSLDKRKRSISGDEEDGDGNDSNTENLTPPCRMESTAITQVAKRTHLGPCRAVGLQKKAVKKMVGKNQPTLLSMFAAIKK